MILNMINHENTIDKIQDRIRGALYGVAIGDAMGGPLEFLDANEIKMRYGQVREMIGGGWLNLKPGEVTDDTQMTLCVAEGILENPSDPVQTIGRRFIEWYDSKPKDIGNTCALAIRKVKLLPNTKKAAWGCGLPRDRAGAARHERRKRSPDADHISSGLLPRPKNKETVRKSHRGNDPPERRKHGHLRTILRFRPHGSLRGLPGP